MDTKWCFGIVALMASGAAAGADGQSLFETRCQSCHRSISVFSNVDAATLRNELANPTRRPHRFELSAEEQQQMLDFILATGAPDRE